ncbi:pyridine nucleotide-disulfide oxidoreductase [Chloropicon primus]|uniref:indole-3-pyruvate monooxygenase n=3 Tax=Chloropicon primus TaxID=1764295 RepID=A0A5B8MGT1_9CHLO|nr:pyridine nucleotide-disulfide oxidoreductase [Chloropicon primus]UPQ98819.1 pyridine nucleotide-disulfide oxidoreductase [Chloropicon primus]|eukprot:QDZ19607.1 pyridine nucleotide-disulfide oxidoreductase [Chloropicon primus]
MAEAKGRKRPSSSSSKASVEALMEEAETLKKRTSELASAFVSIGRKAMKPLMDQVKDEKRENPNKMDFQKPLDMFEMALELDEENEEASEAVSELVSIFEEEDLPRPPPNHEHPYDVIVVGCGASGVGMGLMLTKVFDLDSKRVLIVERGERVGESFRRWPSEMRFISPSINTQGWTDSFDLNSVAFGTSPAYTLHSEHPSGQEYAHYLEELVNANDLNIQFRTEVKSIKSIRRGGFTVEVAGEDVGETTKLRSRYVVWAAGEFQYPQGDDQMFPGSELCRHNSSVRSWKKLPGDDFVVIGGYESGMDAVFNLASSGKRCTAVSSTPYWSVTTDDPSTELSPYTMERVRRAFAASSKPPRLLGPLRVFKVEKKGSEGYVVRARWGAPAEKSGGEHRTPIHEDYEEEVGEVGTEVALRTPHPPLLCTGFGGSVALGPAKDLFEWGEEGSGCMAGCPLLNEYDESTKTPGLFLSGPAVRHDKHVFCFVYKFRQRFGVVAEVIARGLGFYTDDTIQRCRQMNMFLDDFECCKGACGEAC